MYEMTPMLTIELHEQRLREARRRELGEPIGPASHRLSLPDPHEWLTQLPTFGLFATQGRVQATAKHA